jgi:hypothetical protein
MNGLDITPVCRTYAPPALQSAIRKLRNISGQGPLAWLDRVRRQYQRDFPELASKVLSPVRRERILTFATVAWPQSCIEHMIASALKLRGHEVTAIVCGGGLPDCEMHYYDFSRPPCNACISAALDFAGAFGIEVRLSTEWLSEKDKEEATQLVAKMSAEELVCFVHDDVPVGAIGRFLLNVFYQNYLVDPTEEQVGQLRKFCSSSILLSKVARRSLDEIKPSIAMTNNGKAFSYRPFFLQARRSAIRVVTWEEHAFDDEMKFVFSQDNYAGEIHLENAWETERSRPLVPDQEQRITDYFGRWQRAENTPFAYHKDTTTERSFLYNHLQIPGGAGIVACFPNMLRDSLAFDRDIGFESLLDWLLQTVEYASKRPDLHFIVKAHPAEKCLPEEYGKYNRFFICPELRHRRSIPPNVHLLEGDSPVNSYTVLDESDVVVVYTSTVGLESVLRGRTACIVGDVHYRGKGFTVDVEKPVDLWSFLDDGPPYSGATADQIALARRYAYLWRFRHPFTMPYYDADQRSITLPGLELLLPGQDPIVDDLCRCITMGDSFVDIGFGSPGMVRRQ